MFEFKLPDMTCGHCASRVTQALKQADPACEVRVDLPTRQVQVTSQRDRTVLADALLEAGYTPASAASAA
jgi:copper chaperone